MAALTPERPRRPSGSLPGSDRDTEAGRPLVPRVVRLFGPYRPQVALVVLLVVATAGFGVVNPVLIKYVFDNGLFPEADPTSGYCGFWLRPWRQWRRATRCWAWPRHT